MRPGGLRVHLGWLGSLGCALRVVGFIRARPWGHSCGLRCRLVRSVALRGSLGSFGRALGVVGSFRRAPCGSFGFVEFVRALRRVHSCSLGSFGCALAVVRVCWVLWGAPLGRLCSFAFVGFIRARPGGR